MDDDPGRPPPPRAGRVLTFGGLGVAGDGIGRQAARGLLPSRERERPGFRLARRWHGQGAGVSGNPSVASANRGKRASPRPRGTRPHGTRSRSEDAALRVIAVALAPSRSGGTHLRIHRFGTCSPRSRREGRDTGSSATHRFRMCSLAAHPNEPEPTVELAPGTVRDPALRSTG